MARRVAVPALMRMADGTELRAAGIFEFAEGKVALFQVLMDRAAAGLGAGPSRDDAEPPAVDDPRSRGFTDCRIGRRAVALLAVCLTR